MIAILLLSAAQAQEVQGFVELRGAAQLGVDGQPLQLVERVRPSFEAPLGERLALSTTLELRLVQGRNLQSELQRTFEESALGPLLDLAECSWPQEDNARLGISEVQDYLSVDRLALDWYHPDFDLRVGRQALQWGSAQLINPTDPFPEVLFTEPWRPRAGVNAARLTVPIGDRHQVQAVVGSDDLFKKTRLAARGTLNALQTDFSLVSAYREEGEELLTGVDIRGTLGVGFWFEGALHSRGLLGSAIPEQTYEELVVGIDYSLPLLDMAVLSLQYYRNGASTAASSGPLPVGASGIEGPDCGALPGGAALFPPAADPDPFAPRFGGQNYGLLAAMLAVSPDVSTNIAWLQSLDDGSAMLVPGLSVRPSADVEISASGQLAVRTWGAGGSLSPRPRDLRLELPVVPGADPLRVDLSGLVPTASLYLWSRFSF